MDFELSDDQLALRDGARELLDGLAPATRVRTVVDAGGGIDHGLWKAMVEQGWMGGLAEDYCVRATALDAINEGFKVHLISGATRAVNIHPSDGERALEEVRRAGGLIEETSER